MDIMSRLEALGQGYKIKPVTWPEAYYIAIEDDRICSNIAEDYSEERLWKLVGMREVPFEGYTTPSIDEIIPDMKTEEVRLDKIPF